MPVAQMFDQPIRTLDAVIAAVEGHVSHVFGIPGGATASLFSALHEHPTIRTVLVREESIGSAAAEAYGRMGGAPSIVMGQGAWIAGNAGQGFIEALLGSSPVVIFTEMSDGAALSHHGYYQSGTGDYGTWDAVSTLRGMCKRVMVANEPAQAVQMAQLALKYACEGTPGPVAVIFRARSLSGTVGPDDTPRLYPTDRYLRPDSNYVDERELKAALDALRRAERPTILAGNGVRVGQACSFLTALAEELGAPVVTTAGGKGVFDEGHVLSAGVIGSFGRPAANAAVAASDVILAVGTRLATIDTCDESSSLIDPRRQTLIQIDSEAMNARWTLPIDFPVVGSSAYVMHRMITAIRGDDSHNSSDRDSWWRDVKLEVEEVVPLTGAAGEVPMAPYDIIATLNRVLPRDVIVTADAGENRIFMQHWFESAGGGGYLQPASTGGMGYALPAAIGAKLARPGQPVVAVVGDGGLGMTLGSLLTAVEEKIDIGVVVFNNNCLSWATHALRPPVATIFGEFDFAAVASAMGVRAERVSPDRSLEQLIGELSAGTGSWLIDVPTSVEKNTFREIVQPLAAARWLQGSQVNLRN